MPVHAHGVEAERRLSDEALDLPRRPEGAQRERLEVGPVSQQRGGVTLDRLPSPERNESIEPCGDGCELPAAHERLCGPLQLFEQAFRRCEVASMEGEPDRR